MPRKQKAMCLLGVGSSALLQGFEKKPRRRIQGRKQIVMSFTKAIADETRNSNCTLLAGRQPWKPGYVYSIAADLLQDYS